MKEVIGLFFLLIFTGNIHAGVNHIKDFAQSLETFLGINQAGITAIGAVTNFKFSTRLPANAAATYHPFWNRITFHTDVSIQNGPYKRLQTVDELIKNLQYLYPSKIATIFHELGHAEMEKIILANGSSAARRLNQVVQRNIRPWFSRNFSGINSKAAVHELYGYYRTEFIEKMIGDMNDIMLQNGWNWVKKYCFLSMNLKKILPDTEKEAFSQFILPPSLDADTPYRDLIKPRYIFINGKDYDLEAANSPFKSEWFQAMWLFMESAYSPLETLHALLDHMNEHHADRFALAKCRATIWDAYHAENPSALR